MARFSSAGRRSNNSTLVNGLGEVYTAWDMFLGTIPGSIGETSTLAILIGAVILILTGVGNWKIILSVFAGGAAMGLILNAFAVNAFMALPFWQHLILGGFAFGAVFMATDPVSAAQTDRGKWIYGFLIGFLAILIRVLNPAAIFGWGAALIAVVAGLLIFRPARLQGVDESDYAPTNWGTIWVIISGAVVLLLGLGGVLWVLGGGSAG